MAWTTALFAASPSTLPSTSVHLARHPTSGMDGTDGHALRRHRRHEVGGGLCAAEFAAARAHCRSSTLVLPPSSTN